MIAGAGHPRADELRNRSGDGAAARGRCRRPGTGGSEEAGGARSGGRLEEAASRSGAAEEERESM